MVRRMAKRMTAQDWIDFALTTLAREGFAALKADVLARKLGVSRGSFYWHFADVEAFHAAILKHWREVAAERIIAEVEASAGGENPLQLLLRRVFVERLALESAVRSWANVDPAARAAVRAIDRRRIRYVQGLLGSSGLSPDVARARAQILYWAFLGFALSDRPLTRRQQQAVLEEMLRMASS